MARRTMDRRTLREQADAAEAKDREASGVEEVEEEVVEVEVTDEDEAEAEEAAKPKSKSKKKATTPKEKKAPVKRTRAVKEVRMKAVWVVFDNGGKRVKEFAYPQKADAEALLAEKLGDEKKGTYYLQLVKEPLEA